MTRKDLIYLGGVILYVMKYNDPKESPGLRMEYSLEDAAIMFGRLPKYLKFAKKEFDKDKENYQIRDSEISE